MKNIFAPYIQKGKELLHGGARGGDVAPKRDWYIMLSGAVVCMLGFVGVGTYVYSMAMRATAVVSTPPANEGVGLDEKTFSRILEAYRERVADFDTLRIAPELTPVPSGGGALAPDPLLEALTATASTTSTTTTTSTEEGDEPPIRVES